MDEHNELCVKLRAAGMALFRRETEPSEFTVRELP